MNIKEKSSKNNSPNEIKYDEFMDNDYEQINKDISNILFEMRKEKQNYIDNKDNFSQKFIEDEDKANSISYSNQINNKLIPNINNSFIDLKTDNYFNNNTLMNNQMLRYNNTINNIENNNSMIKPNNNYPINMLNNNLPINNINIINNNNNENNKSILNQAITERGTAGLYNIDTPDNIININNVINNTDKRTTLIIRNIPNKYTIPLLLIELNTNFKNKFDVIYLPQDKVNDCNLGYGFINFINPLHLILFYEEFMGKKWNFSNSQKRCYLAYSISQGKNELINYMLKRFGIKKFKNNKKLNDKITKSFYINEIKNTKVPLEIPIKYQIKFESYHPHSLYYKKNDKIFIVETFEQ